MGSCRVPSGSGRSPKESFISVTINNDRYDVSQQVALERKVSAAKSPSSDVRRNVKCGTTSKEKHSESDRRTKSPGNRRHDNSRDSGHRSDRNTSRQSSRGEVRGHDASKEIDSKTKRKVDEQQTKGRQLSTLSKSADNSRHSSDKSFFDEPRHQHHHRNRESPDSGSRRANCRLKVVVSNSNTASKDPTADLSSAENLVVVVNNSRLPGGATQSPGLDTVKERLSHPALNKTVDVGNNTAVTAVKSELQASAGEKITLKFRSATTAASDSPARNASSKPTEQPAAASNSNSSIADLLKAIGFNFELCKQTLQKAHTSLQSVAVCDGDGIASRTAVLPAREETCAGEVPADVVGISKSMVPQANYVPFAYTQPSAEQKSRQFSSLVESASSPLNSRLSSFNWPEGPQASVQPAQVGRELPNSSPLNRLANCAGTDAVASVDLNVQLGLPAVESRSAVAARREHHQQALERVSYHHQVVTEGLSLPARDEQKSFKLDITQRLSPTGQHSDCSQRPKTNQVQENTRQRSRSWQRFASNSSPARTNKGYLSRSRSRERRSTVKYSRSRSRSRSPCSRSRCSRSRSLSPINSTRRTGGRQAAPVRSRFRPRGGEREFGRGLDGRAGRGFQSLWSGGKFRTLSRDFRLQPRAPAARSPVLISRAIAHRKETLPSREECYRAGKRGRSPTGFASSKFSKTSACRERSPREKMQFSPSGRSRRSWKGPLYPRNASALPRPSVAPRSYNEGRGDDDGHAAFTTVANDPWLRSTEEFLIKLHKRNHEDLLSVVKDDAERFHDNDNGELEMNLSKGTGTGNKHAIRGESRTSQPGAETTATSDKKSKKHHKKKKKKKKHAKDRLQEDSEIKSSKKSDESRCNHQIDSNADSVDTAPKHTTTDTAVATAAEPSAAASLPVQPLAVLVSKRTSTNVGQNSSKITSDCRRDSSLVTNLPSGESVDRAALLSATVVCMSKTPDEGSSNGYPTPRVTGTGKGRSVDARGNGSGGADVINGLPLSSSHQENNFICEQAVCSNLPTMASAEFQRPVVLGRDIDGCDVEQKEYNDATVTLNGFSTVTSPFRSADSIQVEAVNRLAVSSGFEPQLGAKSLFTSSSPE